jgi:hypothetical protein
VIKLNDGRNKTEVRVTIKVYANQVSMTPTKRSHDAPIGRETTDMTTTNLPAVAEHCDAMFSPFMSTTTQEPLLSSIVPPEINTAHMDAMSLLTVAAPKILNTERVITNTENGYGTVKVSKMKPLMQPVSATGTCTHFAPKSVSTSNPYATNTTTIDNFQTFPEKGRTVDKTCARFPKGKWRLRLIVRSVQFLPETQTCTSQMEMGTKTQTQTQTATQY